MPSRAVKKGGGRSRASVYETPLVHQFHLMLPTRVRPFSDPRWLFEFKLDGYRILAAKLNGKLELRTRQGQEVSRWFPPVCRALSRIRGDFVMDGEICALDAEGRPDFHALAAHRSARPSRALQPAVLFVFDLLWLKGQDLRRLPIEKRKKLLQRLLGSTPNELLQFVPYAPEQGLKLLEGAARQGLEGVVAKRAGSPYSGGRTRDWVKFIAPGYRRAPKGRV